MTVITHCSFQKIIYQQLFIFLEQQILEQNKKFQFQKIFPFSNGVILTPNTLNGKKKFEQPNRTQFFCACLDRLLRKSH